MMSLAKQSGDPKGFAALSISIDDKCIFTKQK